MRSGYEIELPSSKRRDLVPRDISDSQSSSEAFLFDMELVQVEVEGDFQISLRLGPNAVYSIDIFPPVSSSFYVNLITIPVIVEVKSCTTNVFRTIEQMVHLLTATLCSGVI